MSKGIKLREILFFLLLFLASFIFVISYFNLSSDPLFSYIRNFLDGLLGFNKWALPVFIILISVSLFFESRNFLFHFFSSLFLVLPFIVLFPDINSKSFILKKTIENYVGFTLNYFINIFLFFISFIYFFEISLDDLFNNKIPFFINKIIIIFYLGFIKFFNFFVKFLDFLGSVFIRSYQFVRNIIIGNNKEKENIKEVELKSILDDVKKKGSKNNLEINESGKEYTIEKENKQKKNKVSLTLDIEIDEEFIKENCIRQVDNYYIPSPKFLHTLVSKIYPRPKGNTVKDYSDILEDALNNFGIKAKVIEVTSGPSITRYELQIEKGIKVSQVLRLKNDIALALAAIAVRIEAPIPGKSAIGIEVPNDKPVPVYLSDILLTDEFLNASNEIPLALGKDISGNIVIGDLVKMPHLLIAGSTGSGKTVCINSIICSLLFNFAPTKLQLLLIDPKMVELILYEGGPHVIDIVTDVKKAPVALQQMVKLMEERYKLFSERRVRNIQEYNNLDDVEKIPYVVIVIDELADLMMTSSNVVETHIARLTQLARAAGIHLIIATQRPSANVITGIIKANVPSRIAFAVASQIDSRVILDMSGAENLIGRGDMLYLPIGANRPIRAQGAFIGLKEIETIVKYWSIQPKPDNLIKIDLSSINLNMGSKDLDDDEDPELLKAAAKIILEDKRASTTLLQRKLRIGFAKAGRIMDTLEKFGIVGPQEGSKPRKILIQSIEEIKNIFNSSVKD
ncbi:MAG: DNA translocase FtsK [bacterium]|nr:DNA translocase FtsK [bacterium]